MNILLLSYSFAPNIGGIESHSMILANALTKAGYAVRVLTLTAGEQSADYPFEVLRKPSFGKLWKSYSWADLVFENNPVLNLSFPNVLFRRPRITTLHTWIQPVNGKGPFRSKLKQRWLKKADVVIAVSEALRKHTFSKAHVIPNPYDNAIFQIDSNIPKRKAFVFLGRLVSDKGLSVALDALRIVLQSPQLSVKERQTIQLSVIGEGVEKDRLEQQVQDLEIADAVDFLGRLSGETLVQKLNEHQYILIPSTWEEPFGMVALEAMACGCIPIVSKIGGLPEAIGDAGLSVEAGNAQAWAAEIIRLLQDESLQETLRAKALGHLEKHSSSAITAQYILCIEKFKKQRFKV